MSIKLKSGRRPAPLIYLLEAAGEEVDYRGDFPDVTTEE